MKSRELVIRGPALGELERLLTERGELFADCQSNSEHWQACINENSCAIAYFMYQQMMRKIKIELNGYGEGDQ